MAQAVQESAVNTTEKTETQPNVVPALQDASQDQPKVSEPRNSLEMNYFNTVNGAADQQKDADPKTSEPATSVPKTMDNQANPEDPPAQTDKPKGAKDDTESEVFENQSVAVPEPTV